MTTYIVMAPPEAIGGSITGKDADRIRFVPDSYSWMATFLSLPWLLWNRMWLIALAYVALALGLDLAVIAFDLPVPPLAAVLLSILIGLEANSLRRWSLEKDGWRPAGIVCGQNLAEAEIRFFRQLAAPQTAREAAGRPPSSIVPKIGSEQVVGLTLGSRPLGSPLTGKENF